MPAQQFKVITADEVGGNFDVLLEQVANTVEALSVYRAGEFDPDTPNPKDPVAYLVPAGSAMAAQAQQAGLQLEALKYQVQNGEISVRLQALEQAIKALPESANGVTSHRLLGLASDIEKFLLNGTVPEGSPNA